VNKFLKINIHFHYRERGTHPASYPVDTGLKQPGRVFGNSPPSSAEVKNLCSYTSSPNYAFMAWCLVKHRGNFTYQRFVSVSTENTGGQTLPRCVVIDVYPQMFTRTKFRSWLNLHLKLLL